MFAMEVNDIQCARVL